MDSGWNWTPSIGNSRCRIPITSPSSSDRADTSRLSGRVLGSATREWYLVASNGFSSPRKFPSHHVLSSWFCRGEVSSPSLSFLRKNERSLDDRDIPLGSEFRCLPSGGPPYRCRSIEGLLAFQDQERL